MNPSDLGTCQYDPLYGYTQTPARLTAAGDIAALGSSAVPCFPSTQTGDYPPPPAHPIPTYDIYARYPPYYPSYTAGPPHFYPDLSSFAVKAPGQEFSQVGPPPTVEGPSPAPPGPSIKDMDVKQEQRVADDPASASSHHACVKEGGK